MRKQTHYDFYEAVIVCLKQNIEFDLIMTRCSILISSTHYLELLYSAITTMRCLKCSDLLGALCSEL